MAHPHDESALRKALGLRPDDPLSRLDGRLAPRGRDSLRGTPREEAALLLADAASIRAGTLAHLAFDLPDGEPMPTRFTAPAGSVACAWSVARPAPGAPHAGSRQVRLAARISPLWIDWKASLAARLAGAAGPLRILPGTSVEAARAHDPALPRLMPPGTLARVRAEVPGPLAWSAAVVSGRSLAEDAEDAGVGADPCDLPAGASACLASDGFGSFALLAGPGGIPAGPATLLLALGPEVDLRMAVRKGALRLLSGGAAPAGLPRR